MRKRINLLGVKKNMLTCIRDDGGAKVLCCCECGTTKWVSRVSFRNRHTKSCGCLIRKNSYLMNRKIPSSNTSGTKGVCFNKQSGKWLAYISVEEKRLWLGSFTDYADAVKARCQAECK